MAADTESVIAAAHTLVYMKHDERVVREGLDDDGLTSSLPDYCARLQSLLGSPSSPIDVFQGLNLFGRVAVHCDIRVFRAILPLAWAFVDHRNFNLVRDLFAALRSWAIMMPREMFLELGEHRMAQLEEIVVVNVEVFDDLAAAAMGVIMELTKHIDVDQVVKQPQMRRAVRAAHTGRA